MNPALNAGLRDVKGPLAYPESLLWMLLWVILGLLVVGGVIFWLRWRAKHQKQKEEPLVVQLPWEKAIEELNKLMASGYLEAGKFHLYYAELSDIIRIYIEDRFLIRAPEMTTEEFLFSLKHSTALSPQQKNSLGQFMEAADMVKFAKYRPGIEEAKAGYDLAKIFIEETREKENDGI